MSLCPPSYLSCAFVCCDCDSDCVAPPPSLTAVTDLSAAIDPDSIEVSLYVHMYTKKDLSGVACTSADVDCSRLTRRLPFRFDPERKVMVSRLIPDSSSDVYVFELRVSKCVCVRARCVLNCKIGCLCLRFVV